MPRPVEGSAQRCPGPSLDDGGLLTTENPVLPPRPLGAVEDHQVALNGGAASHVGPSLFNSLLNGAFKAPVQQLALDHRPAGVSEIPSHRPDNQEIRAHPPQAILALDPAAAVHDPLQERLQQ